MAAPSAQVVAALPERFKELAWTQPAPGNGF